MVEGAAEAIPLGYASVDVVDAGSVIEHVVNAQRSFDEAFRVPRPGGGRSYQPALRAIRQVPGARVAADVIVAGCSFAAVK